MNGLKEKGEGRGNVPGNARQSELANYCSWPAGWLEGFASTSFDRSG